MSWSLRRLFQPSAPAARAAADQGDLASVIHTREPWPVTLWVGLKQSALATLGYWGMMSIIAPGEMRPASLLLFGAMMGGMAIATRRSGRVMPPSVLRIGGITVGLIGVSVVAIGVVEREPTAITMGLVFGVLGALGLVMSYRVGRNAHGTVVATAKGATDFVRLPRAELARRVALMREAQARDLRTMRRAMLPVLLGFGALVFVGQSAVVPDWIWGVVFVAFWAAVLGLNWWASRRSNATNARLGLLCPSCGKPMFSASGSQRLMKLIDEVGLCPQCGERITEEDPA